MKTTSLKHLALLACLPVMATSAFADDNYPQRPITLVVGYGAGGSTDVCNRALALNVGKELGQPVVVNNRPGAGSSLSVAYITQQAPDGYTIASLATGGVLNQVLSPSTRYDVTSELTPIAMVAQYQAGLLVHKDSPYQTMQELVEASKQSVKPFIYSTAGIGTPQHLTSERLARQVGVEWVHAPYKSGQEAVAALLRGDVTFMAQTAEWAPYVRSGDLRLLAVFTEARMQGFDAPTLNELGYDMAAPSILGIVGPANMNPAVVQKLQDAFHNATQTSEFTTCAEQFGLKVDYKDANSFGTYVSDTLTDWTPLLKQFASKE